MIEVNMLNVQERMFYFVVPDFAFITLHSVNNLQQILSDPAKKPKVDSKQALYKVTRFMLRRIFDGFVLRQHRSTLHRSTNH